MTPKACRRSSPRRCPADSAAFVLAAVLQQRAHDVHLGVAAAALPPERLISSRITRRLSDAKAGAAVFFGIARPASQPRLAPGRSVRVGVLAVEVAPVSVGEVFAEVADREAQLGVFGVDSEVHPRLNSPSAGEDARCRRERALPDEDAAPALDNERAVLVEAARTHRDDALLRPRAGLPHFEHLGLGVQRFAGVDRMGQAQSPPNQARRRSRSRRDAHTDDNRQREQAIDETAIEAASFTVIAVVVDLVRVVCEQRELDVVGFRDRTGRSGSDRCRRVRSLPESVPPNRFLAAT